MKSLIFIALSLIVLSFLYADFYQAAQQVRRGKGANGWGRNGRYQRFYDIDAMEKLVGEVLHVETFVPFENMQPGVRLIIRVSTDTAEVHLGPCWFIENQEITIQPTELVTVCASKVTMGGHTVFVAATIEHGDDILQLRDENGIAIWSAWKLR